MKKCSTSLTARKVQILLTSVRIVISMDSTNKGAGKSGGTEHFCIDILIHFYCSCLQCTVIISLMVVGTCALHTLSLPSCLLPVTS